MRKPPMDDCGAKKSRIHSGRTDTALRGQEECRRAGRRTVARTSGAPRRLLPRRSPAGACPLHSCGSRRARRRRYTGRCAFWRGERILPCWRSLSNGSRSSDCGSAAYPSCRPRCRGSQGRIRSGSPTRENDVGIASDLHKITAQPR